MSTNIRLIHGDCIEEMQKLAEEGVVVDLVLTDPPYGVLNNSGQFCSETRTDWDNLLDMDGAFLRLAKMLRKGASVVLFSQEPLTAQLRTKQRGNTQFRYGAIWLKNGIANHLGCKKNLCSLYEDISVFEAKHDNILAHPMRPYSKAVLDHIGLSVSEISNILGNGKAEHFLSHDTTQIEKPSSQCYNEMIELFGIDKMDGFKPYEEIYSMCREFNTKHRKTFNLSGKKMKSNVFEYPKESKRYHPTQKPVALLEDLIKTYSNEGNTVLDFTMGSGSTGVACINTGRNFIGIEKDDGYFKVATDRIQQHTRQLKLID